jgi:hypothetical protein
VTRPLEGTIRQFPTSALWWPPKRAEIRHLPVKPHKLQQALDEAPGLAQPHARRLDRPACLPACLNGGIAGGLLSAAFAHRNDPSDTILHIWPSQSQQNAYLKQQSRTAKDECLDHHNPICRSTEQLGKRQKLFKRRKVAHLETVAALGGTKNPMLFFTLARDTPK